MQFGEKLQLREMQLYGSAYTNSAEYLKEFPLLIIVILGVFFIILSVYSYIHSK
jgi:hypothetical protein